MAPFSKVLVANRGEIAIRIFRTLRELGIGSGRRVLGGRSRSLHVRAADEAYLIGPGPAAESYLAASGSSRPPAGGRGGDPSGLRLSRRERWVRARRRGLGPDLDRAAEEAIEAMGSKTRARTAMRAAGVPIMPGATDPVETVADVLRLGEEVGYPLSSRPRRAAAARG